MPEIAATYEEFQPTVPMPQRPETDVREPWSLRGFLFGWASTRETKLQERIDELEAKVQSLTMQCQILAECAENTRLWLQAHTQAAVHASRLLGYREPRAEE